MNKLSDPPRFHGQIITKLWIETSVWNLSSSSFHYTLVLPFLRSGEAPEKMRDEYLEAVIWVSGKDLLQNISQGTRAVIYAPKFLKRS